MKTIKYLSSILLLSLIMAAVQPSITELPGQAKFAYAASVKISKKNATVCKGKTFQLKISGTKEKVKWSSSNKSVATVNSKGKVTGKKKGSATITAKVMGKKYSCKIKVENPKSNKKISTSPKVSGTRTNPKSAYAAFTTDIYAYSTYLGKFTIQLLNYKDGTAAKKLVMKNDYNTKPTSRQEYIYLKFKIKYISGSEEIWGPDVLDYYSGFYNSSANKRINYFASAYDFEDVEDLNGVYLYPGGSAVCSEAFLIPVGDSPITYRLQTGYDNSKEKAIYTWFSTKK